MESTINWKYFDDEFCKYYRADFVRPALPIRLMVLLLILKQLRNLSEEALAEQCSENNYFEYFSSRTSFKAKRPCDPTVLVNFLKRIGVDGIEKIFSDSIRINGKDSKERQVFADTTVQEKNINYPTDSNYIPGPLFSNELSLLKSLLSQKKSASNKI